MPDPIRLTFRLDSINLEKPVRSANPKNRTSQSTKWRTLLKTLCLSVVLLLGAVPGFTQDFLPDRPVGMVNDFADMLTPGEQNQLERKLRAYRDTTTNVIAIATIESLEGYPREEVATELFNRWRMWEGDRYNGVLILISEGDRELRIEVGYGLEGAIPDVMANRIVQDVLIPNLRQGNVYAGLDRATDIMIDLAAGEFEGAPEFSNRNSDDIDIPLDLIIFFIILIIVVISRISGHGGGRGKRRRTLGPMDVIFWGSMLGGGNRGGGSSFGGGGFGGGGFGGFSGGGGFGSGGGGAGGSW